MRGRGKIVHGRGRGIARVNYAEEKDDELEIKATILWKRNENRSWCILF